MRFSFWVIMMNRIHHMLVTPGDIAQHLIWLDFTLLYFTLLYFTWLDLTWLDLTWLDLTWLDLTWPLDIILKRRKKESNWQQSCWRASIFLFFKIETSPIPCAPLKDFKSAHVHVVLVSKSLHAFNTCVSTLGGCAVPRKHFVAFTFIAVPSGTLLLVFFVVWRSTFHIQNDPKK